MVLVICISGCSQQQAEPDVRAELNTPFQLEIGEEAYIQSEDMKVLLVNVTEDSRCPSDVACVWEGQVVVVVNVSQGGQILGSFELVSRTGYENMSVKNFNGYTIKLIGVEPYPESSQGINLSEYTAELKVSKN